LSIFGGSTEILCHPFRFEDDLIVISNYFGRDFRVPFKVVYITPPSFYLKEHYPFEVVDDTVLDIGAYLGDTPLMWLYKGARSVIAVEPVPLHFKYLEKMWRVYLLFALTLRWQ
jgi:hypothetical protein